MSDMISASAATSPPAITAATPLPTTMFFQPPPFNYSSSSFSLFTPPSPFTSVAEVSTTVPDARSRWNYVFNVLRAFPLWNSSMILKDLETADKVMKTEPDETPPSSVDASPLQVNIPIIPPISSSQSQHQQLQQHQQRISAAVASSSATSPYGSPLGASLLGTNLHQFHHLNGDLPLQGGGTIDFAAAIAAAAQQSKPPAIGQHLGPTQNGLLPGPSSGMPPPPQPSQQQQQQNVQQNQQQSQMNSVVQGPNSSQPGQSGIEGSSSGGSVSSAGNGGGPGGPMGQHQMKPIVGIDPSSFSSDFPDNFGDWQSPLLSGYSSSPSPTMQNSMRMGGGGGPMHGGGEDETNRKRQVRLLKNREAAKECRRKKKEYVKCLENRVSVLENQNKALIEELKTLKELYCRKEKNEM